MLTIDLGSTSVVEFVVGEQSVKADLYDIAPLLTEYDQLRGDSRSWTEFDKFAQMLSARYEVTFTRENAIKVYDYTLGLLNVLAEERKKKVTETAGLLTSTLASPATSAAGPNTKSEPGTETSPSSTPNASC